MARQPKFRHVPQGARKMQVKGSPAVIYLYEAGGRPCAVGFWAAQSKPYFGPFHYRSEEERAKRIGERVASAIANAQAAAESAAKEAAARAKPHSLEVGQYLVSSWGYDQTNVDFYRVEKVLGPHMVEIVKVSGINTAHGFAGAMSGHAIPGEKVIGEPMRKRVQPGGSIKIASYAYARIWDGKPVGWTAYA